VNVVLTRELGKNDELKERLPAEANVTEVPLTTTTYFEPGDVRVALEASSVRGQFRSLVVTSARSARYVALALEVATPDVDVFAVGATTSRALVDHGIHVRRHGEGSASSLAPFVSRGPVLMLGATSMRGDLIRALRTRDLDVEEIACYETVGVTLDPSDEAALREADVLFIGAPSSWSVARDLVTTEAWVVVPGPSTGASVRRDHSRVIEGWGPDLAATLAELSN
jgi:uroporphyrinogen-III synthase